MKLGVNIDHVATLRQARRGEVPDPIEAAAICEAAGCDSIVCHLREDRRHIHDEDLKKLRRQVKTKLNLEMSCAQSIVNIALEILPDQVTLVPERREELTTEGGLDVAANRKLIEPVVRKLSAAGIAVSLFIDPEEAQIKVAATLNVDSIELHTGKYANAGNVDEAARQSQVLLQSAQFGRQLKLHIFAGHGLNYKNVPRIARISEIEELNIGHAIISRAVFTGLKNAVTEMLALIK